MEVILYCFLNEFRLARNLFFKMIEKNPEKRITASKALAHEFFTHSKASSLTYDEEIEESMSGLPSENITKINKFKFLI